MNHGHNPGSPNPDDGVSGVIGSKKARRKARAPAERKRRRNSVTPRSGVARDGGEDQPANPNGKCQRKLKRSCPKKAKSAPARPPQTSPGLPFGVSPRLYPALPQTQFVTSPSVNHRLAPGDLTTQAVTKSVQTDLSLEDISLLESASADNMESTEGQGPILQNSVSAEKFSGNFLSQHNIEYLYKNYLKKLVKNI
jgi:hypothetical protein